MKNAPRRRTGTSGRHRWIAYGGIAILMMVFAAFTAAFAQPARPAAGLVRPANASFYHVPIGLCEDYPEESTTLDIIQGDMEVLKHSGIRVLRIAFGWDGIESARGKYNWLFWDDYVKIAVDDYGITLIPYICYTPRWNSTGDTSNYWNHPPIDYEEFGRFVSALVNRYKERIHSWELWNEPDINAFWSGSAEDLARLTKIGSKAVREADPTALVVLAGLANHPDFTRALFRDYGISPYVDVVNMHSYYETWEGNPLETLPDYINTVADIVRRWGNHQSIWMAEVGYSNFRKPDGYVSYDYWCTYGYEHTPEYQAVHLIRTLTLSLATEKLAAIAWYRIKDLPAGENVIGDVNNRYLGITTTEHVPKPAAKAIAFVNTLFGGKYRCIDRETQIHRTIGSDSEVHCFETDKGDVIVVGWLKTCIPGRVGDQPIGNLVDLRRESVSLDLPVKLAGGATSFNELGVRQSFTDLDNTGEKTRITSLPLAGGGITIVRISK